jgi:hypothetical protein
MMEIKSTFGHAVALTPCLPERKSLASAFDLGQELINAKKRCHSRGSACLPVGRGIQANTEFRVKPGMTN